VVLGMLAGVLVVRSHLTATGADVNQEHLAYDVFLAGLGLQGVGEALGGRRV
jgi:hypothetical protein